MQIVLNENLSLLEKKSRELNEAEPIVMVMELGKRDYYQREVVLRYLEILSQFQISNSLYLWMPVKGLQPICHLGQ